MIFFAFADLQKAAFVTIDLQGMQRNLENEKNVY